MNCKKGVSALASMVALGAIIVLVTGTTIWVENSRTANYTSDANSAQAMTAAESGLQDALLKLNLRSTNPNYSVVLSGITVSVCYYSDTPSTGTYTVRTKAIKTGLVKAVKALVTKDPTTFQFKIYSKEEEIDSPCSV